MDFPANVQCQVLDFLLNGHKLAVSENFLQTKNPKWIFRLLTHWHTKYRLCLNFKCPFYSRTKSQEIDKFLSIWTWHVNSVLKINRWNSWKNYSNPLHVQKKKKHQQFQQNMTVSIHRTIWFLWRTQHQTHHINLSSKCLWLPKWEDKKRKKRHNNVVSYFKYTHSHMQTLKVLVFFLSLYYHKRNQLEFEYFERFNFFLLKK